jgi:hypothetical protein
MQAALTRQTLSTRGVCCLQDPWDSPTPCQPLGFQGQCKATKAKPTPSQSRIWSPRSQGREEVPDHMR